MKLLQFKNKSILFGLFFFFLFPVLPIALQSISYVFVLILILFTNVKSTIFNSKNYKIYLSLTAFYWLSLVSLFWTLNTNGFIKEISSNFLIILFPLILFIQLHIERKIVSYLKLTFICASLVLSLKILVYGSYGYMMLEHYYGNLYYYNLNFFERLIKTIPLGYESIYNAAQYTYPNKNGILHRNYSSTIYLISIIFIFSMLKENKKLFIKIISILLIGYFILNIFYYRSLINMALVIFIPFLYFIWSKGFVTLKNISFLFALMVFVIFLFFKDVLQLLERYDIERYVLYTTSFHLIKENYIFGIGLGDVFDVLNNRSQILRATYNIQELNNHSQFLLYFLSSGILGFLLFIFHFFKLFNFLKNDFELFCLLLIVFSNCIFENFLSRMVGVEIFLIVYLIILLKKKKVFNSEFVRCP